MKPRRTFAPEFKAQVVLAVLSGTKTPAEACREHQLKPEILSRWKAHFVQNAAKLFETNSAGNPDQARIAELERMVGRQRQARAPADAAVRSDAEEGGSEMPNDHERSWLCPLPQSGPRLGGDSPQSSLGQ